MKKMFKNLFFFAAMAAMTITAMGCKDPCKDTVCDNGGACDGEGNCICPFPYSGDNCSVEIRSLYYGTYNGDFIIYDPTDDDLAYSGFPIALGSSAVGVNVMNMTLFAQDVDALLLDKEHFKVEDQPFSLDGTSCNIYGDGTLCNNLMTFEGTITIGTQAIEISYHGSK